MERGARLPIVTLLVTTMTAVTTGLGMAYPAFVRAVQRTPATMENGEWWRLVSPILVNPEGWRQVVVNGAGLVTVGAALELLSTQATWLAAYLMGAVVGELAGLAWQPIGAGSSVALCGLLGALAVVLWRRVSTVPARVGAASLVAMGAGLTYASNLHGPPILAGVAVALAVAGGAAVPNE